MLGGWFPSAVNYACYNILSTIAILGPFGAHIRKRSTVYAGLGLGSGMLLVIALRRDDPASRSGRGAIP